MKTLYLIICLSLFAAECFAANNQMVCGTVYCDTNRNNVHDKGEKGIPDVRVSNGRDIVSTDKQGRYQITVNDETLIFIIKPKNWMTPVNEFQLPQFYYIHKPKGSPANLEFPGTAPTGPLPASVDFPLYPVKEPTKFKVAVFGDTQISSEKGINSYARELEELVDRLDVTFGISLGDNTGNWLPMFDVSNRITSTLGKPWYNVQGNHDLNLNAENEKYSNETFERVYGPAYYAFDYGDVHFIVLDSVYALRHKDDDKYLNYRGGFDADQIEFVHNDLAALPKDKLIVLTMHIPLDYRAYDKENLKAFFNEISDRENIIALAGHNHILENTFLDANSLWSGAKPLHTMIVGAVCGSWWEGSLNEENIALGNMACGAPNGYGIFQFNGNKYTMKYFAFDFPEDYQMRIWTPGKIFANQSAQTNIYVNFFAGSSKDTVEMKFGKDGQWTKMKWCPDIDPFIKERNELEKAAKGDKSVTVYDANQYYFSQHNWSALLPANPPTGVHVIYVRATDGYGQVFEGKRIIRIE